MITTLLMKRYFAALAIRRLALVAIALDWVLGALVSTAHVISIDIRYSSWWLASRDTCIPATLAPTPLVDRSTI